MKQLLLIRHAKSDWTDFSIEDFDRPLNDRGIKSIPVMTLRLHNRHIQIDGFISSPAKRAKATAKEFAKAYKAKKENLIFVDKLYLAEPHTFFDVVINANNAWQTIAIFSHNPGISSFANQLTDARVDNIPTCGVFAVKAHCTEWSQFKSSQKDFMFFDFPKNEY